MVDGAVRFDDPLERAVLAAVASIQFDLGAHHSVAALDRRLAPEAGGVVTSAGRPVFRFGRSAEGHRLTVRLAVMEHPPLVAFPAPAWCEGAASPAWVAPARRRGCRASGCVARDE